jgi:hypothetical protein
VEGVFDKPTKASREAGVEGGLETIGRAVRRPLRMDRRAVKGTNMWIVKRVLPCAAVYCGMPHPFFDCIAAS